MTTVGWLVWLTAGAFLEGLSLMGRGSTLSGTVWMLRWDAIGRFVLLPLGCWLFYHWFARPRSFPAFGWRDGVALLIGLLWAVLEAMR